MQLLVASVLFAGLSGAEVPGSVMDRMTHCVECCREDTGAMRGPAEEAARRLARGGRLWASGQPSLVSEITGRAGGIMMIRALGTDAPAENDVVLHAVEDSEPLPEALLQTKAMIVAFGPESVSGVGACFSRHAREFEVSPTLANAVPAWMFTGELVAALTRLGKMPVIYETIGAYTGNARIVQYKNGEVAFHEDLQVRPIGAGVIANRFAETVTGILQRVKREQLPNIRKAARWAAQARKAGHGLTMYSMGHLFPDEVGNTDIGRMFRSAAWSAGFPHAAKPDDAFASGDAVILIGYQHPPDDLLRKARPAGARVVYVSLYADRDYTKDRDVIWIDPMWNWADGCVSIDGYDVPLLPASGIVNGAIAWELYRLASGNDVDRAYPRAIP